jgi:serine/threonine-protein kinase RsbW
MTEAGKVELHIASVPGAEKAAMERAAEVARGMGFSDDRIEDLKTAVAEACINAMEHGNKMDASTKVGVTFTVTGKNLQVDVRDLMDEVQFGSAPEGGNLVRMIIHLDR